MSFDIHLINKLVEEFHNTQLEITERDLYNTPNPEDTLFALCLKDTIEQLQKNYHDNIFEKEEIKLIENKLNYKPNNEEIHEIGKIQYKNMKKIYIKFEDLKDLLDIPPTLKKYANFKQRVLNPTLKALKEFEEFDYINLKEYKKIKSVYQIEFTFVQEAYLRKQAEKKAERAKLRESKNKKKEKPKKSIYESLHDWSKENNNEVVNDYENINTYHSNQKETPKNIYSFLDEWSKS